MLDTITDFTSGWEPSPNSRYMVAIPLAQQFKASLGFSQSSNSLFA